jgi:hypothetical protein
MASKKPAAYSAVKLDTHLAAQLERRSRMIGAPVDDAAIDRILATVDLTGTTGILAPGVEAATLNAGQASAIKRTRWQGEVRSMLSFLAAMVRRRKLNTSQARKKVATTAKALLQAKTVLKDDPAFEAALALAEMALNRVRENLVDARAWTTERIVGEFLPKQYLGMIFGKQPKMTRPSVARLSDKTSRLRPRLGEKLRISETMRFIQAVLSELEISYSRESIIAAMQAAKKEKRYR